MNSLPGSIRLLTLDLDHTLLDSYWRLSPVNRAAVHRIASQGVVVVLASGRMPSAVKMIADELDGLVPYLISYNGARASSVANDELVHNTPIPREALERIADHAYSVGHNLVFFSGNSVYPLALGNTIDSVLEAYAERTKAKFNFIHSLDAIPDRAFEKFFIYEPRLNESNEPDWIEEHESAIAAYYSGHAGEELAILRTRLGYIEVISKQTSKLSALRAVANRLEIKLDQIMAIGDGYNDVEMIGAVGFGVAVGNAVEEAKKVARLVVATNDENGVAEAINKYLGTAGRSRASNI